MEVEVWSTPSGLVKRKTHCLLPRYSAGAGTGDFLPRGGKPRNNGVMVSGQIQSPAGQILGFPGLRIVPCGSRLCPPEFISLMFPQISGEGRATGWVHSLGSSEPGDRTSVQRMDETAH